MVGYLDSSVLLQHILLGDAGIKQVLACDRIISSELLEIECRRVLHRYRMQGNLDDSRYIKALERLENVIAGVSILILSSKVKKRASEAFPIIIKTLDALHLASALMFQAAYPAEYLLIFSYDAGMNRCTRALGLTAPFSVE